MNVFKLSKLTCMANCTIFTEQAAKTQSGWQSRFHLGQKINLVRSLFFMHGLQVQQLMITAM